RNEPVRRRGNGARQRGRRVHPHGSPERPRDRGRPTLLAGGRRRRGDHPRRLRRPAAPAPGERVRKGGRHRASNVRYDPDHVDEIDERGVRQMSRRMIVVLLALSLAIAALASSAALGSGTAQKAPQAHKKTLTFYLVAGIASDAFYLTMNKGAQAE